MSNGSARARTVLWAISPIVALGLLFLEPPSTHLLLDSTKVSEWLAWFGLAGLILAIFQIIKTKNATEASKIAVQNAMLMVRRMDAILDISSAADNLSSAAASLGQNDYLSCVRHCEVAKGRISDGIQSASEDHQATLKRLRKSISDCRIAAKKGSEQGLDDESRYGLSESILDNKRSLLRILDQMKTSTQEA